MRGILGSRLEETSSKEAKEDDLEGMEIDENQLAADAVKIQVPNVHELNLLDCYLRKHV